MLVVPWLMVSFEVASRSDVVGHHGCRSAAARNEPPMRNGVDVCSWTIRYRPSMRRRPSVDQYHRVNGSAESGGDHPGDGYENEHLAVLRREGLGAGRAHSDPSVSEPVPGVEGLTPPCPLGSRFVKSSRPTQAGRSTIRACRVPGRSTVASSARAPESPR